MCSSQCPERALSRRNEFQSEPAVHNRTLNIEAGLNPEELARPGIRQEPNRAALGRGGAATVDEE